jgi:hypothetical protein
VKTDRPVFTGISSGESERSSRLRARMSLQWMVAWFHWNWVMEVLVVCAGGGVAKTPALCVQRSAFGLAWSRSVRASRRRGTGSRADIGMCGVCLRPCILGTRDAVQHESDSGLRRSAARRLLFCILT